MRTVLIGSDFMYDQNGNLIPIEINTNIAFDKTNRLELLEDIYDFSELMLFIQNNGITRVDYVGMLDVMSIELQKELKLLNIDYYYHSENFESDFTVNVEELENQLIIRSTYDAYSVLDSEYCANKLNFLDLIKNESFGSEYAYIAFNDELISTISSIPDNGVHPNFILKVSAPNYDKNVFPKLFKISDLNKIQTILGEYPFGYFMMPFYLNESKLHNNRIVFIRNHSILYMPTLSSINIGNYTKFCGEELPSNPEYGINGELNDSYRKSYLPIVPSIHSYPLLEDTDIVKMADGTFKTALELEVGDILKSIEIPNPNEVNISNNTVNYYIDKDILISESTFSQSTVLKKTKTSEVCTITEITFSDGTKWYDTERSSYLVIIDDEVRFMHIIDIPINSTILMANAINTDTLQFVERTIIDKTSHRSILNGWEITVDNSHIFLTGDEENYENAFLAIEHNGGVGSVCDTSPDCALIAQSPCDKGLVCTAGLSQFCGPKGSPTVTVYTCVNPA